MPNLTDIALPGLGYGIQKWAVTLPNKIAIRHSARQVTYQQLDSLAKYIALQLVKGGLCYEEPVGILTGHGINHIIAQVAVLYAAGTCLPLDPELLSDDMQTRLDVAKVRYLITDTEHEDSRLSTQTRFLVSAPPAEPHRSNGGDSENDKEVTIPAPVRADHRSHILFTSGTTGVPKGVEVPGRGILRLARDKLCFPSPNEEVLGHINSVGFDVSLLDIFGALLNGSTIAVLDRQQALSPEIFAKALRSLGVTSMFLTSSLFNIIAIACPSAFSEMNTLMVGGEPPGVKALQTVFHNGPPKRIVNGYGPTESTVFAVCHCITREEADAGKLFIGKAILETEVYILDHDMKPVEGQGQGELYIGGNGLARGYLNNEGKTREAFVRAPGLGINGKDVLLYRTRDIVKRNRDGNIIWMGRKDREIKIRGYRVNLDIVEANLLDTHLVKVAVAMKIQPPGQIAASLVACVSLEESINIQALHLNLKKRLPAYMIPQIVVIDKIPLNRNGKVDRHKISQDLAETIRNNIRDGKLCTDTLLLDSKLSIVEKRLASVWLRILGTVSPSSITHEADFFHLGATSLSAAALIAEVRCEFNVVLTARAVYEHPTLRALGAVIEKGGADEFGRIEEVVAQCRRDAGLWRRVNWSTDTPHVTDWRAKDEGKVLITGVTGFVGAFVVSEMLALEEVKSIRCLVRSPSAEEGYKRLLKNLEKYNLGKLPRDHLSKLEVISGDFAHPRLGLSEDDFDALANWASVVFHMGAQVNYNQPYSAHRSANVLGTLHMVQLSLSGRIKPFHYTSSIAAYGPTRFAKRQLISEDEPIAPFIETSVPYEGGYGQSQWVADEIVSKLMLAGLPIAIYRLGFVLCDSKTGTGNPDDFVSRLLKDCMEHGTYPLLRNQRKELVPVDYAASAILAISKSQTNLGKAYHICPDVDKSLDVIDLFEMVARIQNLELRGLEYPEWVERVKKTTTVGSGSRLEALIPMLEEKVYGDMTRWEVYEDMARFKSDNTSRALGKDNNVFCTHIDEVVLRRYLDTLQ
ncbi:antibiotic synthetase [Durotheca rogersii]|uniref:antibiotic synthetase n=1 Tax=Durotheca rogersii TaxID=419775 RepID=UPI00221EBDF7|nr:antibiotic synthetase [Durotheca rogersii]KAI5866402.1 antibiotic synthetase [Durotheca rogersii]